ncbi:MAG TPA: hypothetical protein IGS52_15395 [Oscillatoriaceae cyanobacterium M33_DOE_052]|uniref:Uncharacterized protein n=1 Tax=Planktothricoides sp. SpSt-374 TaxID=2282167 RepID=A0A7C3ZR78_9CYAN|nr:hypothetical protein [Oscillatoriaceae cyanobacterium M33_DOE_052]
MWILFFALVGAKHSADKLWAKMPRLFAECFALFRPEGFLLGTETGFLWRICVQVRDIWLRNPVSVNK